MRSLTAQRGVAMVVALFALVLVAGIGTLLFTRSVNEIKHSADDAAIVQTLLLARGGSNVAGALLRNDISQMLDVAVRYTSSPGRWAYGTGAGETPDAGAVMSGLDGVISRLQPAVDALLCDTPIIPADSGGEVELRLYFASTACGVALPTDVRLPAPRFVSGSPRNADGIGQQTYALPFVLVSEANLGQYRRNIVTQGEYHFDIGKTPFSMWAYFTNREVSRDYRGSWVDKIYFTDQTMIDGPTHTNGHFAFAYDPWFGGTVSSAGCNDANCTSVSRGAYLYNYEHTIQENCRWVTNTSYVRDNNGPWVRQGSRGNYTYRAYRPGDSSSSRYRRVDTQDWVCDTRTVDLIPDTVLGDSPNYGGNAPMFTGVTWDSPHIALPDNNINQRNVAAGTSRADAGIVFASGLYSLELFAGTNATWTGDMTSVIPQWRNNRWQQRVGGTWRDVELEDLTYQYVRACTTASNCEVFRINAAGLVEEYRSNNWVPRANGKPFNGVIYADGAVQRLTGPTRTGSGSGTAAPALAPFAQITLASNHDVRITGDLKYADPPCDSIPTRNNDRSGNPANCDNLGATNVLGIYTQAGNILVGHGNNTGSLNAPNDVVVHSVLMSAENEIKVENYQSGDSGGFYLTGGMIQERRGIFGTFSGRGNNATRTGYDRIYTYDPRMGRGMAPPFFPATTMDNVASVRPFTFGQREQLFD